MMVTFVSQCQKNALAKTRRVLDAYANRIGDNTWQTVITEDGLQTVKKMLRKTASKSTAVSCHWLRSRSRSQLLWIVGNRNKFNFEGIVPVNRTLHDPHLSDREQGWLLNEGIVLASGLAGLFHDFGKANDMFQQKLRGESGSLAEPYRHEWVSLRLFEALVKNQTDTEWLEKLVSLQNSGNAEKLEQEIMRWVHKDGVTDSGENGQRVFEGLAPFAQLVAWLIVSHHRLPMAHGSSPSNDEMGAWLIKCFDSHWNSKNALNLAELDQDKIGLNWHFSDGTPLLSKTWQARAAKLAQRTLNYPQLAIQPHWLQQRFVAHLSRLSLMLADHYYSALPAEDSNTKWQDPAYAAIANTDRDQNKSQKKVPAAKQKLDEHNIGVGVNAMSFARNLPSLKYTLPAIAQLRLFSQPAKDKKYDWQNKAFNAAKQLAKSSETQGFFGVNMASTGCGKTIANARIMYALADEREGCRFSVALGLRTLTLQTGEAYRKLLKLGDDDLAVMIGSQAVQSLHQLAKQSEPPAELENGSESASDFFDSNYISYDGQIYDGRLKKWLSTNPKLEKLISAPVLVSTIDHLMPATESKRGGKQIAPMLRLLSSDLVLDEPDDFGLEDLPALCRLVNWAGMLGSRVLLSSATLPPSLVSALFEAYASGRKHFNQANYADLKEHPVQCGWFDEFTSETQAIYTKSELRKVHKIFVEKRVKKLTATSATLRQGKIVALNSDALSSELPSTLPKPDAQTIYEMIANTVHEQIHALHDNHHVSDSQSRKLSLGVVRIANINPLVAIAKCLVNLAPKPDYSIHVCVYHSQFPLALRSHKENKLDRLLTRYNEQKIWQQPEIERALKNTKTRNNIFIVLGTSVVEVGRDHDYDWAIAEPSSLRSIIQLAGRVQRHRQHTPTSENIVIFNKNFRALQGNQPRYCKPGFESKSLPLASDDLTELLNNELEDINAFSRIEEPQFIERDINIDPKNKPSAYPVNSFRTQEHRAMKFQLDIIRKLGRYFSPKEASQWWKEANHADWNAEFIKQTEFRQSQPQEEFVLRLPEDEDLAWYQLDRTKIPAVYVTQNSRFTNDTVTLADGNHWWFNDKTESIYQQLAEDLDIEVRRASNQFGTIGLREPKKDTTPTAWVWHRQLGVYEIKHN